MYLQITGKLNQYINIHYSYLAYISIFLTFILALVQLYIWMKQMQIESHLKSWSAKVMSIILLAVPVAVGILVPTVTLDSTTVSAKGYHFPLADGADPSVEDDGTTVQYLMPDTSLYFTSAAYKSEMKSLLEKYSGTDTLEITTENYMEVMEIIYKYPNEFIGREITYTGFVYNDPQNEKNQFLFRFGVIHCIADSGVYGLMTTDTNQHYDNNTWLNVKGTISVEYNQNLKQAIPVLHIEEEKAVNQPDNPYVYRVF